ncbi:hypothetical protein SGLAM104S_01838 [Streptomyces glaucescens]
MAGAAGVAVRAPLISRAGVGQARPALRPSAGVTRAGDSGSRRGSGPGCRPDASTKAAPGKPYTVQVRAMLAAAGWFSCPAPGSARPARPGAAAGAVGAGDRASDGVVVAEGFPAGGAETATEVSAAGGADTTDVFAAEAPRQQAVAAGPVAVPRAQAVRCERRSMRASPLMRPVLAAAAQEGLDVLCLPGAERLEEVPLQLLVLRFQLGDPPGPGRVPRGGRSPGPWRR